MMTLQRTKELIRSLDPVAVWPEMAEMIDRFDPHGTLGVWEYPLAACTAVGGPDNSATAGCAAILCSLISIHLLDDMLDEDPGGIQHRLGEGRTANLAMAFQAAGHQVLDDDRLAPHTRAAVHLALARMTLATACGQNLDMRVIADEDQYWGVVEAKTSPLFSAAFSIGSLLGGASPATAQHLAGLGGLLGRCVQVSDDLLDALRTPAAADWGSRRSNNLAILYAMTAEHAEKKEFLELSKHAEDPTALASAQEILVRSGALSYCVFKMVGFLGQAGRLLAGLSLPAPESVARLFEAHAKPIHHLFAAAGVPAGLSDSFLRS
ncbi:MAG TPA: hypothetical protein DD490_08350 [Acidobacteria bacterium]|nr:hypothetical protein [Acidobacteriota bacterium]